MKLGAQAKVTLKCPVGPVCTLKMTYPSGSTAKLPAPTHPNPGWWVWTWTIPTSAKGGEATGTSTCTYAGSPHKGQVSFTLVAPTPKWSIHVDMPASHTHTTGTLDVVINIVGTLPESPSHPHQVVRCEIGIGTTGGGSHTEPFYIDWDNGDPPIMWTWNEEFDPTEVGPATWSMQCTSYYVSPVHWESDSGTLEIT